MMGADTHAIRDPDVPETTFAGPDLTVFLGLEPLGWGNLGGPVPHGGAGGCGVPHAGRV